MAKIRKFIGKGKFCLKSNPDKPEEPNLKKQISNKSKILNSKSKIKFPIHFSNVLYQPDMVIPAAH